MPSARTVLIAPDSFKGSLTSVEVARALADGWSLGPAGDDGLALPARRRRRRDARRPSPRPAVGSGRTAATDPLGTPDPRPLAPLRRRDAGRRRDGRGVRLVAGRARRTRRRGGHLGRDRRADSRGDRCRRAIDRPGDRRQRHDRWRCRPAPGAGCGDGSRRGGVRPRGSRSTPGRRRSRRRVRRLEPVARALGCGSHLRPAEGRLAIGRHRPGRAGSPRLPTGWRRSSARAFATCPAPALPAGSGSDCSRSRAGSVRSRCAPGWIS